MKSVKISSVALVILIAFLSLPDVLHSNESQIKYTGEEEILAGLKLIYELKIEEAKAVFMGMIEKYPESAAGLYYFTASLSAPEESNRRWTRTARLYGYTDPPKRPMKNIKRILRNMQRVIKQCEAILEKNPDDFEAHLYLAGSYAFNARVKMYNGKIFSSMRDAKKAAKLFDKLMAKHPDVGDAKLGPGVYKYMVGRLSAPMRLMIRLLGLSGTKKEGIALIEGAYKEGVLSSMEAANLLAWIYDILERDNEKALKWAKVLEERIPESPLADSYRLFIYHRMGDLENEEKSIVSLMAKMAKASKEMRDDWMPLLTFAHGVINEKKGRVESAKNLFEKALAMKVVDRWLKKEIKWRIRDVAKLSNAQMDYVKMGNAAEIPDRMKPNEAPNR
ncbi:MAG: hypothetical protein V3S46_03970 [Nitrospinota bacterium]